MRIAVMKFGGTSVADADAIRRVAGIVQAEIVRGSRPVDTDAGLRGNIRVALAYLDSWLRGNGAAAIDNLMEDAATAEIARSLLWLWRERGTRLADGRVVDDALYRRIRDEELARLGGAGEGRLADAAEVLDSLVLTDNPPDFLTLPAYSRLD